MMKKRYYSLDTTKAIMAFFIVCLHAYLPEEMKDYVRTLARMAVPFFFMVSGFFSFSLKDYTKADYRKKLSKLLEHILTMIQIDAAYLLFNTFVLGKSVASQWKILQGTNFLMANFGVAGHIWFMRALIYLQIFVILFHRVLKSPKFKYVVVGVWLFDLICCKYSFLFDLQLVSSSNREIITKFIGNAFVYFFLGWEIKREEERISKWVRDRVGGKKWGIMLLIALLLSLMEYKVLEMNQTNIMPVNYFFTFVSVFLLFGLLIAYPNLGKNTFVNFVGEKASMYIYYWHIIVRGSLSKLSKVIGVQTTIMTNAFSLYIVTAIIAILIAQVKKIRD